jgi:hypothetical protein
VIIPISIFGQSIHQSAHRNLKYILIVCFASAGGESMAPFMLSSQVTDSVIETLKMEGYRMGLHVILEHRQKPYMSAALSQQYATTVVIS